MFGEKYLCNLTVRSWAVMTSCMLVRLKAIKVFETVVSFVGFFFNFHLIRPNHSNFLPVSFQYLSYFTKSIRVGLSIRQEFPVYRASF